MQLPFNAVQATPTTARPAHASWLRPQVGSGSSAVQVPDVLQLLLNALPRRQPGPDLPNHASWLRLFFFNNFRTCSLAPLVLRGPTAKAQVAPAKPQVASGSSVVQVRDVLFGTFGSLLAYAAAPQCSAQAAPSRARGPKFFCWCTFLSLCRWQD